jgi:hypothetical protein
MIKKSDMRKISPVLDEIGAVTLLNCLIFLKTSEENL